MGKGSKRRNLDKRFCDENQINRNWDNIFNKPSEVLCIPEKISCHHSKFKNNVVYCIPNDKFSCPFQKFNN